MDILTTKLKPGHLVLEGITLHHVRVPLVEPFRISSGEVAVKDAIVIEVRTTSGVTGWGEASPMAGAFYSADTPESVWAALCEKLIPLAFGDEPIEVAQFFMRLRQIPGEPFAKAGLEGALWEALAIEQHIPLCRLFGATAKPIPSGVAIGIYDRTDDLLTRVERFVGDGYRRVKIKIQPGWDEEPLAAIRTRFPEVPLMVDANAAYTLDDISVLRRLDDYDLMMIEQPLARQAFEEAAELQGQLRTPLCADESAESLDALERIIALRAAHIINIKVQRVGGLSEAREMLKRARAAGLDCWVGTMPELGIASAQGLHFAALEGFAYPTDIEASTRWFVDDIVEPAIELGDQGFIHLPGGAGTGFQAARNKIEQYGVATQAFKR